MIAPRCPRLLHDALLVTAADPACAARAAVIADGASHSYAELADAALRLAAALRARGVAVGDRIAIDMDNTWRCVVSIHAVLLAGAVCMPIHPQTRADKLAYLLADSGARVLFADAAQADTVRAALAQLPQTPIVILCGADGSGPGAPAGVAAADVAAEDFDALIAATAPLPRPVPAIVHDLAALIYTSGSSGQPKGVMQTHASTTFARDSLIEYLRLDRDDVILCALPLAFDYGLYQALMCARLGATLVLERSFAYPARVFERMHACGVTVFPGVPTLFALLLAAHGRAPLRFPRVARVTNTAAALPDDVAVRLREVFPNAAIYKMYGLTECKRVCYLEPGLIDAKPGSVGQAIPGTEVMVLAPDGAPVAAGETGILHVRGPHVMAGYWNDPVASARMLKPGRWPGERILCTHDQFRVDADGFLYFVGRSDDIIKTRGEKVSPVEVENALHAIPGVREAAVIGVPDALLGEAIRAYLVLDADIARDERRLRAQCMARLEPHMVPRDLVFCDALPVTATGKVSRRLLREAAPA